MRVCSLFSGIGGIDLGFIQAGFDIVWANEIEKYAAATYCHNFGTTNFLKADIRKVDVDTIPAFDVLVAGFPCQSFSKGGKKRGFDDERGSLFFQVVRIAQSRRPRIIFLENVANLLEHDEGKSFLTVYNALAPLGYSFKYQVLEPYEYGDVPQRRSRIFIVCFLDIEECDGFSFPERIELKQNLADMIDRSEKHSECYYYDESHRNYQELLPLVTRNDCVYKIYDWGVSRDAYTICPTLTAYMERCFERVPIIRDDYGIRRLTPYECLKLQGFPDDFKFAPNTPMRNAYKQVGNSVCVPVIKRIADRIKASMESL